MNKSYLIVPVILLALFGFAYNSGLKDMKAREDANHAKVLAKAAEEKKHKDEVDAKAAADAKKHQEERDAEERKKQEKKQADYDDAMKKLRDEANDYTAQAEKLGKEAADLEKQISDGRNEKEKLNRENLDLAKAVELAKINRRNAELEIQRMIDMVAKKVNDSSITAAPPLSPPPPAAK